MWSAPERKASVGVTTRRWSSVRAASAGRMPGVTISGCEPNAARKRRRFEAGRNDAVAAGSDRLSRTLQTSSSTRQADAHLGEIARQDARQHRDDEDLEPLALGLRRGFHDRAIAMHGQERCPGAAELAHGRRHRRGNVVELQVGEDLLVASNEPIEQLEVVPRRRELEPDLVEHDAVGESARRAVARLSRSGTSSAKISRSRLAMRWGEVGIAAATAKFYQPLAFGAQRVAGLQREAVRHACDVVGHDAGRARGIAAAASSLARAACSSGIRS